MTNPQPQPDDRIAQEARDWIVRLTSGAAGAEDLARFHAWRGRSAAHAAAFARERAFWQDLKVLAPARRTMSRRQTLAGGALLAAGVAGVVIAPRLALWRADLHTDVGEMAAFSLPDGSGATLNTGSALDLGPGLRAAHLLRGEAEFRIRPQDAPFRLSAGGGTCETDGATFTVRLEDGLTRVSVAEGRVRVATQDLTADMETSFAHGQAARSPVPLDPELAFAWREGRIIFEGRPMGEALHELGRYIPERIVLGPRGDASVPVSAVFSTREARAAVSALARTQRLSARRIPGVAILLL